MSGARSLPWRYGCPAERHRGLKQSGDGAYCQSCGREFTSVIDLRDGVAIDPEAV